MRLSVTCMSIGFISGNLSYVIIQTNEHIDLGNDPLQIKCQTNGSFRQIIGYTIMRHRQLGKSQSVSNESENLNHFILSDALVTQSYDILKGRVMTAWYDKYVEKRGYLMNTKSLPAGDADLTLVIPNDKVNCYDEAIYSCTLLGALPKTEYTTSTHITVAISGKPIYLLSCVTCLAMISIWWTTTFKQPFSQV